MGEQYAYQVTAYDPNGDTLSYSLVQPVTVQDVGTGDPNRSVMVYSNKDDVTVIWVFAADTGGHDD